MTTPVSGIHALAPGTQLGAYRIDSLIGAGGMGEVYRARDTRLDRVVAIKILPPHVRQSADRQARFEREAAMISQLTHPHICTLHDIGRQDGTDFLVMEYLDGETLAARLARGAVPVAQAVQIGLEVASALDHAHRHGIVHRDLKPSNVMLTRSGAKLLDFGLAKLAPPAPDDSTTTADLAGPTASGTLVGTLAYMAPEQVEGKEADARADIWALGCVVYEMVTGRRAFEGASPASVIAAILERAPTSLTSLQPLAPPLLDQVVQGCLVKDREERCQSVADVGRELQWIAQPAPQATATSEQTAAGHWGRRRRWILTTSAAVSLLAATSFIFLSSREKSPPPTPARFQLISPKGVTVEYPQISPDGRRIVFIGHEAAGIGRKQQLWIHMLDSGTASLLAGTQAARNPFWAPDGQSIAFLTPEGALKRIDVSGGAALTVCSGLSINNVAGTWSESGIILFQQGTGRQGLFQVPAAGGMPVPATKLDVARREISHSAPHFLPDGRHFLYVVHSAEAKWSGLYVRSLDSGSPKRVLEIETSATFAAGYLLYSRDGAIVAQRFDADRLELSGDAIPIASDDEYQSHFGAPQFAISGRNAPRWGVAATTQLFGAAVFSASDTGLLAFSLVEPPLAQFAWFDRHGAPLGDVGPPGAFYTFDLSRDGKRLVVAEARIDRMNLSIIELDRNNRAGQFTFGRKILGDPRWGPDGRVAVTSTGDDETRAIVEIDPDEKETVLVEERFLDDWSRDGRYLLDRSTSSVDVRALPLFGDRTPIVVRDGAQDIDQARFSPDGRWVAYNSSDSGTWQVYVERFPPGGSRKQVSVDLGVQPVWRADGRELYYLGRDGALFAVDIRAGANLDVGLPQRLFQAPVGAVAWSVEQYTTVDGTRFLVLKPVERPSRPIEVIVNWPAALQGRR